MITAAAIGARVRAGNRDIDVVGVVTNVSGTRRSRMRRGLGGNSWAFASTRVRFAVRRFQAPCCAAARAGSTGAFTLQERGHGCSAYSCAHGDAILTSTGE